METMKSGITGRAEVIFGGRIQLFIGWDDENNRGCIELSELKRDGKAGDKIPHNTPTFGPQVIMVFDDPKSIDIVRDSLDALERCFKGDKLYLKSDEENSSN